MQSAEQGLNLYQPTEVTCSLPHLASLQLEEIITPPANRLIDIVKKHHPVVKPLLSLPEDAHHAARIMTMCHTSALGGHVEKCPDGHISRIFYNSCGHRFCPRCAARLRHKWLINRQSKLLPVRHYHTIFTLPHTFNPLWRYNPKELGDLLFHSGVDALRALLADPRWLGANVGITVTLETWDDRMNYHPHLHCIVTGGGLTPEGEWVDVKNPSCLVAVKPLMWEFRKRFCQSLKELLKENELTIPKGTKKREWIGKLNKTNRQNWSVFIAKQPEDGGPTSEEILRYLSENVAGGPLAGDRIKSQSSELTENQLAYLKSAPLTESRVAEEKEGVISFYWGTYDPHTGRRERDQIETLPADEFLQRYLQHVPLSGYQVVRHYGLYTSAQKKAYEQCVDLLSDRIPPESTDNTKDEAIQDNESWILDHTCNVCGKPLIVTAYIPSSLTGHIVKRPPLGSVSLRSPPGGAVLCH